MFGRNKNEQAAPRTGSSVIGARSRPAAESPVVESPTREGAKNRPTPSRREAEAARRRPIVPADREAAKKQEKARVREERVKHREAMYRGEEWALAPRDRGPERAFVRDMVDSRWNLGEFLLPVMVIGLPVSLLPYSWAQLTGLVVLYGMLLATIVDLVFLNRRIATAVRAKFGHAPARGTWYYVFSRAVQLRGGRVPRPRVARGGAPLV